MIRVIYSRKYLLILVIILSLFILPKKKIKREAIRFFNKIAVEIYRKNTRSIYADLSNFKPRQMSKLRSVLHYEKNEVNVLTEKRAKTQEKAMGVFELSNATVFGEDGFVADSNESIISETVEPLIKNNNFLKKVYLPKIPKNRVKIPKRAALLSGNWSWCYYHFLIDILPKLSLLHEAGSEYDYLVLPSRSTPFIRKISEYLLLPEEKILYLSEANYEFKTLYLPLFSAYDNDEKKSSWYQAQDWALSYIRDRFFAKLPSTKGSYPKNIYITRCKSRFRRLINENEIVSFLEKKGFQTVCLEDLSISEQVATFKNADRVISLHGSGLANLVFSKKGCKVLEIFPHFAFDDQFPTMCQFHSLPALCSKMKLDHYYLIGEQTDFKPKYIQDLVLHNIYLDRKKLETFLKSTDFLKCPF